MNTFPIRFNNLIKLALMLILLVSLWWLVQPALAATTIHDNTFNNRQLLSPHAQCANYITVTTNGDSGPGTLRQALIDICSGGTIDFGPGLASDTITLTSDQLTISKTVTITNPNAPNLKISGNNAHRVFNIQSGAVVTMSNLGIISGTLNSGGGGILNDGTLTIYNSIISGNTVNLSYGGGIHNSALLTIYNSSINNNSTYVGGGGFYNGEDAVANVSNCTLNNNSAGDGGGGIDNYRGTLILTNTTFNDNSTSTFGGGIKNNHILTVTNCSFNNNSAEQGGGIHNWSDNSHTVVVNSCTFDNNSANNDGGGIFNDFNSNFIITESSFISNSAVGSGGGIKANGPLTVNNSTFYNNSAGSSGGGIVQASQGVMVVNNSTFTANSSYGFFGGGGISAYGIATINNSTFSDNFSVNGGEGIRNKGTLHLRNSIIANSNRLDCSNDDTIATNINNLIEDGSCSPTLSGDPNLGLLQDNGGSTFTHALLDGSPAIDAGSCSGTTTDQRGFTRPVDIPTISNADDGCDIGAYEFQQNQAPFAPSNPIPANASTNISTTQTLSWQGGDPDGDVVTYTIAFGTNNPPSLAGTTTQTSYTPALVTGTTYYWIITATDGISESVGELWSFVTSATASSDANSVYLPIVLK